MKFCYHCGQTTPGTPRYCHSCGRSYDSKLCPRHHVNRRWAEVCATCGSRELSTPQPHVSIGWRLLEWLARIFTGAILTFLTTEIILDAFAGVLEKQTIERLLLPSFLLIILWSLWSRLPHSFRTLVRKSFERSIPRQEA